jgi:hypothetical protein
MMVTALLALMPIVIRTVMTLINYIMDLIIWVGMTAEFMWTWITTVTWPNIQSLFISGLYIGSQWVFELFSGDSPAFYRFLAYTILNCNNQGAPNTGPPTTMPIPTNVPGIFVTGCVLVHIVFQYFKYLV